jgi:hypothetical protein
MIKRVEMFTAICNNCKTDICAGTEHSCWDNESLIIEMEEQDWYNEDGRQYCNECYHFDEENSLCVNVNRWKEDV